MEVSNGTGRDEWLYMHGSICSISNVSQIMNNTVRLLSHKEQVAEDIQMKSKEVD